MEINTSFLRNQAYESCFLSSDLEYLFGFITIALSKNTFFSIVNINLNSLTGKKFILTYSNYSIVVEFENG